MRALESAVFSLVLFAQLVAAAPSLAAEGPTPEPLWPRGAPDAFDKQPQDIPTITAYPVAATGQGTGTGVVILPGGGYWTVAMDHEGHQVARFLNELGVSAFVVEYRHAPRYQHPIPMLDAQRAIRLVRSRAVKYRLAPDRIGVMGFSAGGHLAATVSTRFDNGDPRARDAADRSSSRPDFAILGYPVISLIAPYAHRGSAEALLGRNADARILEEMSADSRVSAQTPPTFLFHTSEDSGVPAENSIAYYLALRQYRIPAELHIYEKGKHGVGLAGSNPILSSWGKRLGDWLRTRGLLEPPPSCKISGKGDSPVARACAAAGIPAAKQTMRDLVAAARTRGKAFECDGCHQDEALTADARERFAELLRVARRR